MGARVMSLGWAILAGIIPVGVAAGQAVPSTYDSTSKILVGVEYIPIDNLGRVGAFARELAPVGFTTMKHYAEHAEWGAMQSGPAAPVDFRRLDAYVREFQSAGVSDLVVCLRSASGWASKHAPRIKPSNLTPKPQYLGLYERWISAIVERYDRDGTNDMPGLRHPVRYYEIGSEFSSYEPEPVDEYLAMLRVAYQAAHRAYPAVQVAHAALLTTGAAFSKHPGPAGYNAAFAAIPPRIAEHSLSEIRKLLDQPDIFDVVNLHSLGDPSEIDDLTAWLEWEMGRRGYRKRVIISDTAVTPWIAWGNATVCKGPAPLMGVMIEPASEADRCRLAGYFKKLVDGDAATVRWTQGQAGSDNVKRVIVAADRGILLINTAFVEDLVWLKLKPLGAGTGPSAWSGLLDLARREHRPGFYALQQLMKQLEGHDRVRRLPSSDPEVRLYQIEQGSTRRWVVWLDPRRPMLPDDPSPTRDVLVSTTSARASIEPLIMEPGVKEPSRRIVPASGGRVTVSAGLTPVFVIPTP